MQDYRIALQESLMTTLITHVPSLQRQLSTALGQIQALQARDQTHADDREGAGTEGVVMLSQYVAQMVREDWNQCSISSTVLLDEPSEVLLHTTFPWNCSNIVELPHKDCYSRLAYNMD
ncbi:hypothetical protein Tco_1523884 [Tanacetum coccineum]